MNEMHKTIDQQRQQIEESEKSIEVLMAGKLLVPIPMSGFT